MDITLEQQIKSLDLKQNAIKILINSFYGAFGNRYFYFHNNDIAQSITLQGQDLIKFAIKAINHYFLNRWHLDTELHEKLGFSNMQINQIEKEAAIYTDTDSVYTCLEYAIDSIQADLNLTDIQALQLVLDINEYRLKDYFQQCFERYAQHFHTQNRQNFELENISRAGVFVAKKKYVLAVASKGTRLMPKETLLIKGLEAIQASYPIWARDHLKEIYWIILNKGYDLDLEKDLIPVFTEMRKELDDLHIEDIAFNFSVRVFEEHLRTLVPLVMEKGMPIYGRASAYHNHVIKKTKNEKYAMIRSGSKIKFYYADPNNEYGFDIFAYAPGNFPEFALPIDREQQFFRLIVEPINKLLLAMGFTALTAKLTRKVEVIKTRSRTQVFTDADIYPLYAVDSETLEYYEIPKACQDYVGDSEKQIPDELFPIFLSSITKFGLSTVIVPKHELQKYRARVAKRKGMEIDDPFALTVEEKSKMLTDSGWTFLGEDSWILTEIYEKRIATNKDYSKQVFPLEKAYKKQERINKKMQLQPHPEAEHHEKQIKEDSKSKEEIYKFLNDNGWEQSWDNDNWVRSASPNKEANTGISTESAYKRTLAILSNSPTITYSKEEVEFFNK